MLDIWGRGLHICEVWVRHVGVRVKHLGGQGLYICGVRVECV